MNWRPRVENVSQIAVRRFLLHLPSVFRAAFFRLAAPLFFRKVGRGCRIHKGQRFGRPLTNVSVGDRCVIKYDIFYQTGRGSVIQIGDDCMINTGCHLVAAESITIGAGTAIAEYVSIRDQNHVFDFENSVRSAGLSVAPITIGKNVWIGRGVYIGAGTILGDGCVVGANSVVHGEFPAGALIAGAPAKIKRIYGDGAHKSYGAAPNAG